MRAQNKLKTTKSFNKAQKSKTISTNKTATLKLKTNKNKIKSKNKDSKSKEKFFKSKSKPKEIKINKTNPELNYDINLNNNYQTCDNYYKSNANYDNYNNINSFAEFSLNDNLINNSISTNYKKNFDKTNSLNLLLNGDHNLETNIKFKISIDRLLLSSQNLLEKQNNIITECDKLTKNMATNDYSIQNLIKNENKYNYENLIAESTKNISQILSKVKKNDRDFELNIKLKNENDALKSKLEMANIDNQDNFKIKCNEITNLKIVLSNEINHFLNFLKEIGYDNLPMEKTEMINITSQKITDFFQMIKKIIKQMKEIIQNKETMISKMTIEQATNRSKNNSNLDNIINKSYEKLPLDYNNYGFKTYNFSVRNDIHNKTYNISFRNYPKNNKEDSIIEKTQKSLNISELQNNKYFQNKEENNDKYKYKVNEIIINKNAENNNINNSIENCDNINNNLNYYRPNNTYSIDDTDRNYKTGNFNINDILLNNQNNK